MLQKHIQLQHAADKIHTLYPKGKSAAKNFSLQAYWEMLFDIRLLRYVHASQIPKIQSKYRKICSLKNLRNLCGFGYLRECENKEVFIATDEVIKFLPYVEWGKEDKEKRDVNFLPEKESIGKGDVNEILNTETFIQAMKLPDFYTLHYTSEFKDSHDIVPDALLIRKDSYKYKLTFLEIEAKKSNWLSILENKKNNYIDLSRDIRIYDYWKKQCNKLKLRIPTIEEFKFSVKFICALQKPFGKGFKFETALT